MKKRSEIAEEYKWDLSDYAISAEDCLHKAEAIQKSLDKFKEFENNLKDEENIFKCLELQSRVSNELVKLCIYADSKKNEDTSNDEHSELVSKVEAIFTEFALKVSFVDVQICALDDTVLLKLQNNPKYSNFSNYFKDIIRSKKYILSDKEEAILSQIQNFSGGFQDNLAYYQSSDIKFKPATDSVGKEYETSFSTYGDLMSSDDPILRENAYKSINGEFKNLENTLANNYASHIKMESTLAKIRGYDSVLQSALYHDNLTTKFYNLLIKIVKENAHIFQNALKAKKMALGLKEIKISDMYADVGNAPKKEITFSQAFETVKATLNPLGQEYLDAFELSRTQRWIDIYDNQNKRSGEYETCAYKCHPLVFLKFNNDISSTSTLAHELGHALHSYFSDKNQPYEKAQYPIFLAEVASTVNETFLSLHLINNAQTLDEKAYYQNQFLDQARATILRQTKFAEFEKLVFEKYDTDKALSKRFFQDTYQKLCEEYYGNGIKLLDETKYEYSRIPHFFREFYVYKYATGMLSAILIVKKFMDKEENIQENYIKFLSSGSSLTPLETLKIVGVDLEKEETFDEAFEFLNRIEKDFENSVNNLKK